MRYILFVSMLLLIMVTVAQDDEPLPPALVVLEVEGNIDYARQGWTTVQSLVAGTFLRTTDLVYPEDAILLVLCPDGQTQEFLSSDLLPNDIVRCDDQGDPIIGSEGGLQRIAIQRGGTQQFDVPYLISPRATLLLSPAVTARWNHIGDAVAAYQLILRDESGVVWESASLAPADVVSENVASTSLPELSANTGYSLEICVNFNDGTSRTCTTDSGWNTSADLTFTYVPDDTLTNLLDSVAANLGGETPQSRYAQAALLAQPTTDADPPVGYYDEAITLLETLLTEHPDSALATSPDTLLLLGDLYRDVNLPLSATRTYQQAINRATPGTITAARANLGRARTTPLGDEIDFYSAALDDYCAFLEPDAFAEQYVAICDIIGDICASIPPLETYTNCGA